MKAKDIRELTDGEIQARITEEQDSLLRLKFNNAISEIENPAKIRAARTNIARLKTIKRQREIAAQNSKG